MAENKEINKEQTNKEQIKKDDVKKKVLSVKLNQSLSNDSLILKNNELLNIYKKPMADLTEDDLSKFTLLQCKIKEFTSRAGDFLGLRAYIRVNESYIISRVLNDTEVKIIKQYNPILFDLSANTQNYVPCKFISFSIYDKERQVNRIAYKYMIYLSDKVIIGNERDRTGKVIGGWIHDKELETIKISNLTANDEDKILFTYMSDEDYENLNIQETSFSERYIGNELFD